MGVKSKKWYEKNIGLYEHALENLHREGERMSHIYTNDLPEFYRAVRPINERYAEIKNKLENLKDEYYLYYR